MKLRLLPILFLTGIFFSAEAQPLGVLTRDLVAREAYAGPSAYMDFYHGLTLSQEGVDLSLAGLLSIDGVLSARTLREEDIKRLYPFPNTLTVLRMTGEEVRKYLEKSYDGWIVTVSGPGDAAIPVGSNGKFRNSPANFDSAGGLNYTVDVRKPCGERVRILSLADGRAFDETAVYRVGMSNYRASGAGKLLQAAGIDPKDLGDRIVREGKPFRDIVKEYFQAHSEADPARMRSGSWAFIPEEIAGPAIQRSLSQVFPVERAPYYDTRSEIAADLEKAGGVHYLYPAGQPRPTPAPKGYKPFYMSHLGRHGARFALGSTVYEDQWSVWSKAYEKGLLTPEGEAVYEAYASLYPSLTRREGNLTRKGQEQLRAIARQMLRDYPALFKGETRADAVSTDIHRVIVSMYSLLGELDSRDKDFEYTTDYGYPYQAYLLPTVPEAYQTLPGPAERKLKRFRTDLLDLPGMLERWFTVPDSLVSDPYAFCSGLHTVVSTLDNLDVPVPGRLQQVFTPSERYRLWEVSNYIGYLRYGRSPDAPNVRAEAMQDLWQDIVGKADAAIASGSPRLDLRFAHDSTILPLLSLLDVNGMGVRVSDPYAVENYWRSFDIPMACNLQLVFFRGRSGTDILVQVLLNGKEATLPLGMAAPGCFYRWEEVRRLSSTDRR